MVRRATVRITAAGFTAALAIAACAQATSTQPGAAGAASAETTRAEAQAATPVNEDARISSEFLKRVEDYVALHQKLERSLPRLPREATPDQIDKHQRALGKLIEGARPKALQGDIFAKETRAYIRRQIARAMAGQDARQILSSIMDENPGPIKLRINGRYPDTVPLATMPPRVLQNLPKLPEEMEFRFIGERLILLDVHAHLIVDYIDDALPN